MICKGTPALVPTRLNAAAIGAEKSSQAIILRGIEGSRACAKSVAKAEACLVKCKLMP
jgi:hypothetical protein